MSEELRTRAIRKICSSIFLVQYSVFVFQIKDMPSPWAAALHSLTHPGDPDIKGNITQAISKITFFFEEAEEEGRECLKNV